MAPGSDHLDSLLTPPLSDNAARQSWRASTLWIIGVAVVAAAILTGTILSGAFQNNEVARFDQTHFHYPVVETFAKTWPHFDFSGPGYRTATTPLYHLTLAAVEHFLSDDIRAVRGVGALFSVLFILAVAVGSYRPGDAFGAAILALPLLCSRYSFQSSAWIVPDNFSWLFVTLMMIIAVRPVFDRRVLVWGGVVLFLLVACRQVHIWTAGLIWAAGWFGSADEFYTADGRERSFLDSMLSRPAARARRAALAVLATLPAWALLAWFVNRWGGLVPPNFQGGVIDPVTGEEFFRNSGFSPSAGAFLLALFGLFGPFHLGYAYRLAGRTPPLARRRAFVIIAAAAAIGAAFCALTPTMYSYEAGRYSGLWNLTRRFPAVADRSLLIIGLGAVGAAVLAALGVLIGPRTRWMFFVAILGFAAAHYPQFACFQRYIEPFVLMVLAMASARVGGDHPDPQERPPLAAHAGPLVLSLGLAVVTVLWAS